MDYNNLSQNMDTSDNIRHFDGLTVANQFITYFYQAWTNDPYILMVDVIKPYSKLRYNNNTFEGIQFIETLKELSINNLNFSNCKLEILDSGSRQIYILVTGIISDNFGSKDFTQSFMLAYAGENNKNSPKKWILMNSILIIK